MVAIGLVFLGLLLITWAELAVGGCADRIFAVDQAPARRVALVLGTSPQLADGRGNHYFTARIAAAVRLYRAGTVERLLVSGDNHRAGYDEPTEMRAALLAAGIPDAAIRRDYAGFRTLDSVVRAKEVFGLDRCLIVSQHFHNLRALYLARSIGLDAVAADAADPPTSVLRLWLRERLARVACVLDIHVFGTGPRFLGPKEPL